MALVEICDACGKELEWMRSNIDRMCALETLHQHIFDRGSIRERRYTLSVTSNYTQPAIYHFCSEECLRNSLQKWIDSDTEVKKQKER